MKTTLADKRTMLQIINNRIKEPKLPDSSYRELVKKRNELIADIQELELNDQQSTEFPTPPLSFEL